MLSSTRRERLIRDAFVISVEKDTWSSRGIDGIECLKKSEGFDEGISSPGLSHTTHSYWQRIHLGRANTGRHRHTKSESYVVYRPLTKV